MRPVAQIAQSVEQGIENPRVGGSIPSLGTTNTEKPQGTTCSLGFFIACDSIASTRNEYSSLACHGKYQRRSQPFHINVTTATRSWSET